MLSSPGLKFVGWGQWSQAWGQVLGGGTFLSVQLLSQLLRPHFADPGAGRPWPSPSSPKHQSSFPDPGPEAQLRFPPQVPLTPPTTTLSPTSVFAKNSLQTPLTAKLTGPSWKNDIMALPAWITATNWIPLREHSESVEREGQPYPQKFHQKKKNAQHHPKARWLQTDQPAFTDGGTEAWTLSLSSNPQAAVSRIPSPTPPSPPPLPHVGPPSSALQKG